MRSAVFFLTGLLLTACAPSVPTDRTSVEDVRNNIHAWNSEKVVIEGWLGTCEGYGCTIYHNANSGAVEQGLSIGGDDAFDLSAEALQGKRVILTARINDRCFPANCTDRADILQPIEIRAWYPSAVSK